MEIEITEPLRIEVDAIGVSVAVEYEEEDMPNDFPFRSGEMWDVVLDIATGKIRDWPQGISHKLHMKVCDMGVYSLMSGDRVVKTRENDYVPSCLPNSYGDYLDFDIAADGTLKGWKPTAAEIVASFYGSND